MSGTPFGTAIIPLGDAVEYAMLCKTCEFRGLACAFQRAGEHTLRVKTFGEGLAQSRPRIHSLLPAYLSQRDVRSPGMLPGFTPKSLTMSQQYQEPRLAEIGNQPYIATAPLLYVFVIDEHRNARIAQRKGIDPGSDEFHLKYSYRFTQAQNDAVLALHAMETAAYSLGLGGVILGSLLNDIPALIDLLNLPEYTYPVLGLALGKPDQEPTLKPRMPRSMQFFDNTYPADADGMLEQLPDFDNKVHQYYDLRQTDRPVDAFSDQIASVSRQGVSGKTLLDKAAAQGFQLDK